MATVDAYLVVTMHLQSTL